jgi:hypothetical protein
VVRLSSCDRCEAQIRFRDIKKIGKIKYCNDCYTEIKKHHRQETIEALKVIREIKEKQVALPKIFNKPKDKKSKGKISQKGLYLTKAEKSYLLNHLKDNGLSEEEAYNRVGKVTQHIYKVRDELKNNNKSKENLSKKFKEEFKKICQSTGTN